MGSYKIEGETKGWPGDLMNVENEHDMVDLSAQEEEARA